MYHPLIESVISLFSLHPYALIFVGMIFAGETVLIPSLALAFAGKLHIHYVLGIATLATLIADLIWYHIGAHMHRAFSRRLIGTKLLAQIEKLSGTFSRREAAVLFLSKFVYGTRVAAHLLAGIKRMHLGKYLFVNFLGTTALFACISLLVYSIDASVTGVQNLVHQLSIVFLIAIVLSIMGHIIFGKYIQKKWFQ